MSLKDLVTKSRNTPVWITDPIYGRTLAMVDQTGVGYFVLLGEAVLPQPLLAGLRPEAALTLSQEMDRLPEESKDDFLSAWEHLTEKGFDALTVHRGLLWAIENGGMFVDPDLIARQGVEETQRVVRAKVDLQVRLGAGK